MPPSLYAYRGLARPGCRMQRSIERRTRVRGGSYRQTSHCERVVCARAAGTRPVSTELAACALQAALVSLTLCAGPEAATAAIHAEPANALSVPTWAVHVSSVAEWLLAMDLVWRYGDATGRPAWRGMSWGMLPLHTSSLCACTYHLFYNAPELSALVTLQAGLTLFGNCTLAAAAVRVAAETASLPPASLRPQAAVGDDSSFLLKAVVASFVGGALVKYSSLLSDVPFTPSLSLSLAIVGAGTVATAAALASRGAASLERDTT